jgi:hypothetical protein
MCVFLDNLTFINNHVKGLHKLGHTDNDEHFIIERFSK